MIGFLLSFTDRGPCLAWILGHSFVFRGQYVAGSSVKHREDVVVRWLGKRGMRWSDVMPEFHYFVRLDRPPDVLVLHIGGNDLGVRPF